MPVVAAGPGLVLGGSNTVFENGDVSMARRGHIRDLGQRTRTWRAAVTARRQAFLSDPMRFVDFGDASREGGS